jgi:NADPH:quinone reductase-like Zn-dependent oxidoreductase
LEAIEKVKVKLDAEGVFARVVKTKGKAYHSHHMAPASATYEKLVQAAKEHKPFDPPTPTTTRMVSSVTNRVIPDMTVLDEKYWSNNLRSPVLFNQAVQTILTSDNFKDVDVLIEVGPHSAMSGPIKQIKTKLGREQLEYFPTLLRGTDCAIQLLNLAGELFLLGYPLDMERVAAAYVEESPSGASKTSKIQPTKGSIIVDLPPYQWNYTREFWAESRSSREQRQPKYPRHDVLGQRVIGSSMSEPTWRNILRIRDLPWLSDHNLGGEVVFPAAGYFAMAIEAATQLDELSDAPVNIESYVLRDVTIQKALVVPDGDDGIEVLLNIRPSVYGSRWWDFGVSSIDENDVKKDHMVGTIGINNKKQHSPRKIPQFPQRVTGSAWNQALRDVGFDYGWTFKDMDDICFDGKHYEASCTTNIKQQVDESLGESRYVLHPASVDSLLQLSIVAIYAGRTKAMDYGVIPIQLDEVIIWTPSQEQVRTTKANAYAWVDQRGIRSFESSGQLTAHDGTLIMEIVNLRGVSYEAAVTQKAASVLEESPYSQIRWEIDFNSIDTASDIDGLTATDLVNLVLFKSPANKILQLGLPTEQNVKKIFDSNPLAPYTVAVASDVEIDAAKKMLEGYQSAKVFELDLAQDSASESTSTESYDIAVPNESIQIASASKFLKTSGYLITPEGVDSTYLATDFDIIAKGNTGPTIYKLSNQETTNGHASISVEKQHSVQLIYRTSQAPILLPVKSALEALGWSVGVSSLKNCSQLSIAEHVIMLADFEGPLIFTINDEEFAMAQKIINTASSLLWVTAGGLLDGKQPEFAMVPGLARTITSERATIDFRTIDIDEESVTLEQTVSSIVKVAHQQSVLSEKAPERELRLANGKTHISRLTRHDNLNSRFSTSQIPEPKKFLPGDRIFGKVIKGKVVFQPEITIGQEDIKPGHVQVEVQASGLTKEGVLVIAGSDYPTTFSYEIGGIVKKVGQGVKTLQSGDRVVGFNADRFASYQEVPESMLYKIQEGEDINTAVGALTAYAAALYGLETLAATKASEYILILNGTGLSGIAAIKVAQAKKAVPYVVVDSNDEADFIEKHALLDRRQIILSNSTNYSIFDKLQELTNGHAVDVVFGSGVSYQDIAHEAWRCISRFGRFVDGGRKDVLQRKALDAVPLNQRGASYLSFDILDLYRSRPQVLAGFLPVILSMLREGQAVVPGPIQQVNMADLDEAFTRFSDAFGAPKSIIAYENYEKSIQLLLTRPRYQFNPNSTYLLVGCLGGLGRSLTSWMMGSGAKRFIFLSRSGTDTPSAAQLVRKLEQEGAVVQVVRGDATSRADVVRATKQASFEYPIRGVIHAAMVLQVSRDIFS